MVTASEVAASNLEVASVQEPLVQRYTTIDRHLLGGSAAHVVVCAFYNGAAFCIRERSRAILCIVDNRPDTGACLHLCLVTGIIVGRFEIADSGVLVELITFVARCSFSRFLSRLAIANVVVVVGIGLVVHRGGIQLATGIVPERVIDR